MAYILCQRTKLYYNFVNVQRDLWEDRHGAKWSMHRSNPNPANKYGAKVPTGSVARRSDRQMEARNRALRALAAMRHGASLSLAARENGVTIRTIRRYVGT